MNWLDLVIALVVLLYLVGGSNRGTLRSVLSLAGFLAAIYVASHLYQPIGSVLRMIIGNSAWAEFVAFVLVFVILTGIAAVLGTLGIRYLRLPKKNNVDRLVGAVLGFIEGLLAAQLFVILFVKFPVWEFLVSTIQNSMIANQLLLHPDVLLALLPPKFL